jgi:hypothetical protein
VAGEGAEAAGGPLPLQRPTSAEQIDDAAVGEQAAASTPSAIRASALKTIAVMWPNITTNRMTGQAIQNTRSTRAAV